MNGPFQYGLEFRQYLPTFTRNLYNLLWCCWC